MDRLQIRNRSGYLLIPVQFEKILEVWRCRRFCKVRSKRQKLVPLSDILKCKRIGHKYAVRLAYGIVKCLNYLHEWGLVQANFTLDDIQVELTVSVSIPIEPVIPTQEHHKNTPI